MEPAVELLTAAEVAKALKIGRWRVYRLISVGDLPSVSLGTRQVRVDAAALRDWVARGGSQQREVR